MEDETSTENTNSLTTSLEELKRRLSSAQPVVVTQSGALQHPKDSAAEDIPSDKKTTVKPSRWYS